MKHIVILLGAFFFCISCAALPEVIQANPPALQNIQSRCLMLFPTGNWQFVHRIEAIFPGDVRSEVMGITTLSSSDRSVRCIIMTIEGLVVFDAVYDQRLTVKRSISPFDSNDFAQGLINDIQLIFFPPEGLPTQAGKLQNGYDVCRYQKAGGQTVDIVCPSDLFRLLRQYDPEKQLSRTLKAFFRKAEDPVKSAGFPHRLELEAHHSPEYTLVMDLLEAVPVAR